MVYLALTELRGRAAIAGRGLGVLLLVAIASILVLDVSVPVLSLTADALVVLPLMIHLVARAQDASEDRPVYLGLLPLGKNPVAVVQLLTPVAVQVIGTGLAALLLACAAEARDLPAPTLLSTWLLGAFFLALSQWITVQWELLALARGTPRRVVVAALGGLGIVGVGLAMTYGPIKLVVLSSSSSLTPGHWLAVLLMFSAYLLVLSWALAVRRDPVSTQ